MSVMRRPVNKFVIPCSALAVLLSSLASATTVVSPGFGTASRAVNFADLDLSNGKAVATLYHRIKSAAGQVCDSDEPTSLHTLPYVRICQEQAIDQAVKDVNSYGLTSFHAAATNRMDFQ
jgi:UrcA family protein